VTARDTRPAGQEAAVRTVKVHGEANSYKAGCRCAECRRAHCIEKKRWHLGYTGRLMDSTGTKRRIQALVALGWTLGEIAAACEKRSGNAWTNEVLRSARVHSTTEALIRSAYDRMSMIRPEGPYRNRQRATAARKGYAPPLAWDDIDDPLERPSGIAGEGNMVPAELMFEDWDFLRRQGYTRRGAAERMGITKKRLEKAIERHSQRMAS
jgi:hypothetical protein